MLLSNIKYLTAGRIQYVYKEFICKMFADKNSKSIILQVCEMIKLMYRVKFWPQNYFKYEGYKKGVSVDFVEKYIPGMLFSDLRADLLNDSRYCVFADDKYIFHQRMKSANVPTPKLLGIYKSGLVSVNNHKTINVRDFFRTLDVDGVVIKPTIDSCQGEGVNVINIEKSNGNKFFVKQRSFSHDELSDWIRSEYGNSQLLIEGIICQHSALKIIYSKSVNTVRVDTLRTRSGKVIINSAYLRVGRNGRRVDNWSGKLGGIGINIDVKTGKSFGQGIDYSLNRYDSHPETGIKFNTIQIPFWDEIINMVKHGAVNLPNLNSLGWDIAITENGPVAVEVNADYDILAQQTCTQSFGSNVEYIKALKEYVDSSNKGKKYAKHFNYWG